MSHPILVTGSSGFVGYHLSRRLLEDGFSVHGVDNHNDYYSPKLKQARLAQLKRFPRFQFTGGDIADREFVPHYFSTLKPTVVIHLAAQAGVRYSLENPAAYIDSNLVGFANILEGCRHHRPNQLLYASSSSVYGGNSKVPFSVDDRCDHPVSLYAATKKANELMAHTYSHLYEVPATGLRFFTVYGPWGRPDMAYWKFAEAILEGRPIEVYNHGKLRRDFTYIDDIVESILRLIKLGFSGSEGAAPHRLFNIGASEPVDLMMFIETLEKMLGKSTEKRFVAMQPGDVHATYADVSSLEKVTGFRPRVSLADGLKRFADWFKLYRTGQP